VALVALTTATRRNIPEDGILHTDRRENLKFYIALAGCAVRWRCNVSPVRHEMVFIFQKTTFFIVTGVKTSNFT
jgi:hypothetical protein